MAKGGSVETESLYVVDYDIPRNQSGRRQFYRYLNKILDGCNWKRSSQSVILVDERLVALHIAQLAKAYNANYVNVYEAVRV